MDLIKKLREVGRPVLRPDGTVELAGIDFSAADTYLRCPEQYRRRYIEGKKSPPGVALIEGTSHHHAMEHDNKSKRDKGKQLPAKHLTELFEAKLDEEHEKAEQACAEAKVKFDWEGEDRGRLLARAKVLHVDWHGRHSAAFDPEGVEETFSKDVQARGQSFIAYGQVDLTTKAKAVWDYKTSNKAKRQEDVDQNLQLSLYSWTKGYTDVGIIALVKTATPYIQVVKSTRTPGQHIWAMNVLAAVVDGIRRGSFPLTNPGQFPKPWWCSAKFCGYWDNCRGKWEPNERAEETEA